MCETASRLRWLPDRELRVGIRIESADSSAHSPVSYQFKCSALEANQPQPKRGVNFVPSVVWQYERDTNTEKQEARYSSSLHLLFPPSMVAQNPSRLLSRLNILCWASRVQSACPPISGLVSIHVHKSTRHLTQSPGQLFGSRNGRWRVVRARGP